MTHVRRILIVSRSFMGDGRLSQDKTTETPLPETNGPEKPGRATAPKGAASPIASHAGLIEFAHLASGGSAPADVLGRWFDSSSTNQMHAHTTLAHGGQRGQIAPAVINNLGGTGPPLFHATPPCSTRPQDGSGVNPLEQVEQGNNVSGNKERSLSNIEICSRDEGYVSTPFQLFQQSHPPALSGFSGTGWGVGGTGGPCSSPPTSRESGRNGPTLFQTLFHSEVGA